MPVYRPPRAVIAVSGPEAGDFLDALLTNDVSTATHGRPVHAGLLTPQGKLIADMVVHRADDGTLLLDVAEDRAEDLLRRLTLYRLRRKVDLADVSGRFTVEIHVPGHSLPADPRRPDGALGARIVTAAPAPDPAPFADYEGKRISAGIPDPAVDAAPEEVFALEALFEELHGVDFQKGCFIGQENVSRMKRRATTRKKFCRVTFDGAPPPYGTEVSAGPARLGDIRSARAGVAIALLRLDRAQQAAAAGVPIMAGATPIRLDPPSWLLMPEPSGDD